MANKLRNTLSGSSLTKSYKGRPVVRGASLHVSQGEIVGLLGANGAGKTTCFYMLCGLIKPDSGKITIANQEITEFPMYRRARLGIGYLPQETSIFRGMNVEDNIWVALEATDESNDKKRKTLESLLNAGALKLRGPLRRLQSSFYLTNLLPVSTRLP